MFANWVTLEYALWVALDRAGWDGEIEHRFVPNESATLEDENFEPCVLVRQALDRPPLLPIPGWADISYGGLTLSFPA